MKREQEWVEGGGGQRERGDIIMDSRWQVFSAKSICCIICSGFRRQESHTHNQAANWLSSPLTLSVLNNSETDFKGESPAAIVMWTCPLHVSTGVMHEAVTSSYLPHVGIPLGIFLELRKTCEEQLDHVHQGVLRRLPQQLWVIGNHDTHDANTLRLSTALCNSIREQYFPYWASFL